MRPFILFMWRMYLMSGNLSGWKPKYAVKQDDGSWKLGPFKLSAGIFSLIIVSFMGIGELYNYLYKDAKPNTDDIVNVLKEDKPAPVYKSETEQTDSNGQPLLSSAFTKADVKVDLIVPEGSVQLYKFVKIKTTVQASYYDLSVLTIYNNTIQFVETIETRTPGEWVFTGPPGQYSIRLSSFTDGVGFSAVTGTVTIGGGPVPPPPGPGPGPGPGPVVPPSIPEGKYGFGPAMYKVVMEKVPADIAKKYATKVADNFEAVAAGIAAGSWKTPTEANKELAGKNRFTFQGDDAGLKAWMPFFEAWSAKTTELNKAGKLPNVAAEYAEVYRETQAGLKEIK